MMAPITRHLLSMTLALSLALSVSAQDISRQSSRRDSLQNEIELINRLLSSDRQQKKNDINTLSLTRRKIQKRKALIREMDSRISGYSDSIRAVDAAVRRLSVRLDTLTAYYGAMVYNIYKCRDSRTWFMYLLSSDNLSQAGRRWSYLKNISSSVRTQAGEIKSAREKLDAERGSLDALMKKTSREQLRRKQEFEVLSNEEAALGRSIDSLSRREKAALRQLSAKKKEVERLNREIERLIAEAVRKGRSGDESRQRTATLLTEEFAEARGHIPFPVGGGIIVSPYGQSFHPVFKNVKLPFNNGIDISVTPDTPAVSVFEGEVKQILLIPGYNQCVLVQHGKYYTFYCKLQKVSVKAGQSVYAGDEIGVTWTAADGETVLHFELWEGTSRQNPEDWLEKR